ncbi:MAG: VOC family protein [bacterium]|jgi:catechol 2,3-dioxygenase-like lactoylglutathione lyase family enzyme|nr:VOC family protein [bacterium]
MTPGSPRTAGFDHVATLTPDLDRYVDFYHRTFGARLVRLTEAYEDHPRMATIDVGGGAHLNAFEVAASEIVGQRDRIGRRGPVDHFGFTVGSRQRLEELRDRLVDAGASPGEITDFGSALSVFFRDPDGAELEVCWHVDETG